MISHYLQFKEYCHNYPFSGQVLKQLTETTHKINPQNFDQSIQVINIAESLPVDKVVLILVPNVLSVIVYRSLDDGIYKFGFFESINDQFLIDLCFEYIVKEISLNSTLIGPVNFSTFFSYRFKINSFDKSSFMGEPNNLSYYPELLKKAGFKVYKTYQSQNLSAEAIENIKKDGVSQKLLDKLHLMYRVVSINTTSIPLLAQDIYSLAIKHFLHKSEFIPISFDLFKDIYLNAISPYIDGDYSYAYFNDNQLVGFNFILNNKKYTEKNKVISSPLCSDLIYKTVCVDRKYQGKGLFKLMMVNTLSKYPCGISTTGATMEDGKFVLDYGRRYNGIKVTRYALFER